MARCSGFVLLANKSLFTDLRPTWISLRMLIRFMSAQLTSSLDIKHDVSRWNVKLCRLWLNGNSEQIKSYGSIGGGHKSTVDWTESPESLGRKHSTCSISQFSCGIEHVLYLISID